jgi:hypothetical protein
MEYTCPSDASRPNTTVLKSGNVGWELATEYHSERPEGTTKATKNTKKNHQGHKEHKDGH